MKRLHNQQTEQGFVSIIITMILMIVLTLIVISFSLLSRREGRNALDRQLSTQAFYAAESGVNDFIAAYKDSANASYFNTAGNEKNVLCSNTINIPGLQSGVNILSNAAKVSYTCVLYDTVPKDLNYPNITDSQVTIIPITNTDLTKLDISWGQGSNFRPATSPPSPAALTKFGAANWNSDAGMLRVMLIPRQNITRSNYMSDTFHGWLYPAASGGTGTGVMNFTNGKGNDKSGVLENANCNTGNKPLKCNMQINNIPAQSSRGWYLVIKSIYKSPENVIISCTNSSSPVSGCRGSQIVVDVTGQAQDVIRRVQVRKSLIDSASGFLPIGFESVNSICKQINISPPDVKDVGADSDPACPAF